MSSIEWQPGDTLSAARGNAKTKYTGTGSQIAALGTTYPGQLASSTDNSGGFTQDLLIMRNTDNNAWISAAGNKKHDHSADTDAAGGLLSDVFINNTEKFLYLNMISPVSDMFFQSNTGGTITDDASSTNWRVKLDTGSVASNYCQIDKGSVGLSWGSKIKLQVRVEEQTATTGLQSRIGINCERADTNVGTAKLLSFDFCDATGANYYLASSDGTTRTSVSTGQGFHGVHSIKFLYTPSTNVVGTIDNTTAITKTSNLPNSGAADHNKTFRAGIFTTNTTAKQLYIYGAVVVGTINDAGWL